MGKSWSAIKDLGGDPEVDCSGIYFKASQNKWWDGYTGQDCVLIDELPTEAAKWCTTFLKKWADGLPCLLEVKGGTTYARYTRLIVTCQVSIEKFFSVNGGLMISEEDL